MIRKIRKEVEINVKICDICGKDIKDPFPVSIGDGYYHYDAHQECVKKLIEKNETISHHSIV